ncbi:MAG: DUF4105 domain-containing protein [Longimicrobiales bacterium]
MLHYWSEDGEWRSEVEDPSFFLDPEGPRNPEAEWAAAVQAFLEPDKASDSGVQPRCRFPARYQFLSSVLGWGDAPTPEPLCPQVEAHIVELGARSVSVVFVSHYLGNPASAFGHAMLHLAGEDRSSDAVLTDYSVSFEADTENMAPAEYLPRGLFGGLTAGYRTAPLHERVGRYERRELRDLWTFPLRLTDEEVERLVLHLWELKDLEFGYGFFGENCAQKLLALVHAIAPGYGVLPYRSAAVLPQEVARRLVERVGLASEPGHRPSLIGQYERVVHRLTQGEREGLGEMIASRTVPSQASPDVLNAALLWSEIETPFNAFERGSAESDPDAVWVRSLWTASVANLSTSASSLVAPEPARGASILDAHRPSRVVVRGGYAEGHGSIVGLGVRWLLHDAADPQLGYPRYSTVEVARVDAEASISGHIAVEEATAVRVEALGTSSEFHSPVAWRFEVGARRLSHLGGAPLHFGLEFALGLGASVSAGGTSIGFFSMAGVRPGVALAASGTDFVPTGLWSSGVLLSLPSDVRARLNGEYSFSLASLDGGGAMFSADIRRGLGDDWDAQLVLHRRVDRTTISLGLVSFR